MIKSQIRQIIRTAVRKTYPDLPDVEFSVDEPASEISADLSSNVSFSIAQHQKAKPSDLARKVAENLDRQGVIKDIEIARNMGATTD